MDTEEVVTQFKRCAAGGYNQGAAIVLECDGLLVQCKTGEVVPDGAVSCSPKSKDNSDQYCASPSSVKYVAVIFNVKGLVHCLGDYLKASGYSAAMHDALMEAKRSVAALSSLSPSSSTQGDGQQEMVRITNRFVNKLRGAEQQPNDGNSIWSDPEHLSRRAGGWGKSSSSTGWWNRSSGWSWRGESSEQQQALQQQNNELMEQLRFQLWGQQQTLALLVSQQQQERSVQWARSQQMHMR